MFRIRDILIRIRILDPCTGLWIWFFLFLAVVYKMPTKMSFSNFFLLIASLLLIAYCLLLDNMSLKSHKTVEIMNYRMLTTDPDSKGQKTSGSYCSNACNLYYTITCHKIIPYSGKKFLRIEDNKKLRPDRVHNTTPGACIAAIISIFWACCKSEFLIS